MYQRNTRYPELFKPGNAQVWWAFIPNPNGGRAIRESTGHREEQLAHAWYLDRLRRAYSPENKATRERGLADALDSRIEWLKLARQSKDPSRKKLSAATVDFYEKKSRHVVRLLGEHTPLSAIGHEDIRGYITTRSKEGAKGTTIAKELTALSMGMRLARKDGIACSSFADIVPEDFAAKYVPKTRWLPEDEVERVIRDLPAHRAGIFAFLVSTGATYPSEVQPIREKHRIEKYLIHIPGTKTGARDRDVVIPEYARDWYDFGLRHMPASGFPEWASIRRDFHRSAARLEIAPWSPNDCRRTFAQYLVRSGVPYELAAPMMGHNTTKMLEQVYGKRDAKALAKLVAMALKGAPKNARRAG